MQLMTNINNSEKSGGTVGIEEQSIGATQIISEPPPPSPSDCLYFALFLSVCNA